MTEKPSNSNILALSAAQIPRLYQSRRFWELRFRELGLWPEMLALDPIASRYSDEIDQHFSQFQLLAVLRSDRSKVVGVSHAVPLRIDAECTSLPDGGWDWALATSIMQFSCNTRPNCICGLSITILPEFQRCGIGKALIEETLALASDRGLPNVIMPVRPISKEHWPFVTMNEFLKWSRSDGFHQDPWLRAHQMTGGQILNVCNCSMIVDAPLNLWERWSGCCFLESGDHAVKGALVPVNIDLVHAKGFYREPNVWVIHRDLGKTTSRRNANG